MLWFFERDDESLKLETRYDNDTSEFVVVVRDPDGREHTKRFTESDAYGAWLEAFERDLEHKRWTRRHGPMVIPDGWPNRRLR